MKDNDKNRLQVENNEMDYLQSEYRDDIDNLSYEEKLYIISIYDQMNAKREKIKELDGKVEEMQTKSILNDMIIDPEGENIKRF